MSSKEIVRRLRHVVENVERIRAHVTGMTEDTFLGDPKTQDAVERCLERIAEAARRIGDTFDEKYPQVDFARLRQFGSVLRHDYHNIRPLLIWRAVTDRLPLLEDACRRELQERSP